MFRKQVAMKTYAKILLGTALMAAVVNLIYTPMSMVTGGVAGIGILFHHFFGIPVGLTNWVINVPLLILSGIQKGKDFIKKTIFAVFCFSLLLLIIPIVNVTQGDFWMSALLGGVISGAGLGLVFRCNTSTGGSDLAAALLADWNRKYNVSQYLLFIDASIVLMGAVIFGIYHALYAIAAVFITSKIMDAVLSGTRFGKVIIVISEKSEHMAEQIMEQRKRGVTMVKGVGMYTKSEKDILFCVISKKEIIGVLDIITKEDKNAMVIVADAKEIFGEGFVKIA